MNVSEIIVRTYDHALTADWSALLADVARGAGVDAIGLAFGRDLIARRPPHAYGIAPELVGRYPDYHCRDRVWRSAMCTSPLGATAEILPRRALERTLIYQEWIRPQRWATVFQVPMWNEPGARGGLLVGRHRPGTLPASSTATLGAVVPHLRRILELHRRVERARLLASLTADLIDALPIAVVLLDAERRVVLANRTAERVVADGGASLTGGVLRLTSRAADVRLGAACARAEPCTVAVPRPGRCALDVLIVPLVGPKAAASRGVAVVLHDRERPIKVDRRQLEAIYGLTPAQARLTALLVQGYSLEESAALLRVTLATVRDRVKQIFARTGARRQSDLLRIVLTGPVVFGRTDASDGLGAGLRDLLPLDFLTDRLRDTAD